MDSSKALSYKGVTMTIRTKTILDGFTSAFDITGSYYRASRKRNMHKLNSKIGSNSKIDPIRKATILIGEAFKDQDSLIDEKK
jgi:hypothetical protein